MHVAAGLSATANISESKDWRSYWEMDKQNRPAPCDYANDKEFWYNLPAKLLKALERYDNAPDDNARQEAKREVSKTCSDFDRTKSQLIATYGKTRFMEQPDGYIADHNHHKHLAALTQDAQWLFLYENALIKDLKKWSAGN